MARYEVYVGNIGRVYDGGSNLEASKTYAHYVKLSKAGSGRAAGESVVIMKNGEPEREFAGESGDRRRGRRLGRGGARGTHGDARVSGLASLRARGFDGTKHIPGTKRYRIKCSQCQAMTINGIPVHERGCPNERRSRMDEDDSGDRRRGRRVVPAPTGEIIGYYVMKYSGGRYGSVGFYGTKSEAAREVARIKTAGAWSGMPPKVEPAHKRPWGARKRTGARNSRGRFTRAR